MWVTPQHFTGMHFLAQFLEKNQLPMSNFWSMYEKFPFRPQHLSCLFCAVEVMPKKNPQKTLLTTFQSTKVHREPNGKHLWCVRFSAAGSTDTVGSHSEIHHIETLTATVHFENLTSLNYQHYFANLQHRHSIKMNSFLLSRFCANSQLFVIKEKDASKRNGLICLFFFFLIFIKNDCFVIGKKKEKKCFLSSLQNFELLRFTIKAHLKDWYTTGTDRSYHFQPTLPKLFHSWISPPLQAHSHTSPVQRQLFDASVITTFSLHLFFWRPWSVCSWAHLASLPSSFEWWQFAFETAELWWRYWMCSEWNMLLPMGSPKVKVWHFHSSP